MKKQTDKLKWNESSADRASLSLTIRGLLFMIIPSVMKLVALVWPMLNQFDAYVIVNELSFIITGVIVGVGAVRRIYNIYIKPYMK